jgi:hypothetical protein
MLISAFSQVILTSSAVQSLRKHPYNWKRIREKFYPQSSLEKFASGASQELLQTASDVSHALKLVSDQFDSNSAKLQEISDGLGKYKRR